MVKARLTGAQADVALKHSANLDALQRALANVRIANNPGLEMTLSRAIHDEERKARGRLQTDPVVAQALEQKRTAEDAEISKQRKALKQQMQAAADAKQTQREAKQAQTQLQQVRAQLREAQNLKATKDALKSYTPEMLGHGRRGGGVVAHRSRRQEVLDRLASQGSLTAAQRNDWQWFKDEWDSKMAEIHGELWGQKFAEIAQGLLAQMENGSQSAVSLFMYAETRRVLCNVPVLRL